MNDKVREVFLMNKEKFNEIVQNKELEYPVLFWAGKMSQVIQSIRGVAEISDQIELLKLYSNEYDNIIFDVSNMKNLKKQSLNKDN